MKRFITTLAAACIALTTAAQHPMFPGGGHVVWKDKMQKQFLMLPVQESCDVANISVIVANNKQQSLNVKLAVDKVDYYVPFNISQFNGKDVVFDIEFWGDRKEKQTVEKYLCWREISQSDNFDTQNRERFRPAYHHTPQYGWMNDPNGMFYLDGKYHLYFQWNPYGSQWENMTWGHSVSEDLVTWRYEKPAIEPDALGAIFSGSCVVDQNNTAGFGKNAVVAFYTSAGKSQMQSMAYSLDGGVTFNKYSNNPVLIGDCPDFRDPKVIWNEDAKHWNMVLAAGQELRIYSSNNLKDWKYESSFGKGYGCHDGVWECPDLMKIGNKWLMIC
ncbi:MAG: DUF4980 domain-containing protein, partial [Bacteroidales bacterium]|nr:DUF4980 domain-containing protein [Bacteroidales bacterium]